MKPEQVRRHFAETAKTMILENGIESVSIRRIADKAGYAYASIYNHFHNLDELLWYTRSLFIQEMALFLMTNGKLHPSGPSALKAAFQGYLCWFLERPHVYRFLHFHQLDRSSKTVDSLADAPDFEQRRNESFAFLAEAGWKPNDIEIFGKTLIHAAQGMLTLAVTGNDATETEEYSREMDDLIDFMLQKGKML